MRDREQIFSDYLVELRQREKEESRTHREKVDCILSSDDVLVRVKLMFCVLLQQPRHSDPLHSFDMFDMTALLQTH